MSEPPGTVLVVDDSDAKRYLLASWLKRAGFTVVEADSGGGALDRVERGGIDLVLLDVRLGDMSGLEVCAQIKADPRHAAVPVVHVSAHAVEVADRALGLTGGADAYLAEPIEPDELVATAHAVLRYYRARQRAERLAARLTRLADTTIAVNAAGSHAELLATAAAGAAGVFDTGAVVIAGSTDGDVVAAAVTAPGVAAVTSSWGDRGATVGTTVRRDVAGRWPAFGVPPEAEVAVGSARLRSDRPAVHVVVPPAALTDGPAVLSQLVQAFAAAAEAQRSYDEEHGIALTLQRSLLPQRLPSVPGFDLAVRYVPASARAEVGGDFYELAMIGDRLLVAIGDVAGHSLHAATVMAELRHAVRAYALEGHPPGAVLRRLNELVCTLLPEETATICLFALEPGSGRIQLASAGHLPPLLVTRDGTSLVLHRAPLLGIRANRPDDLHLTLPPGGTLVLYTDGLVERRYAEIDVGLDALIAATARIEPDLDQFCERLLTELAPDINDDIAVVVVRRH